MTTIVCLANSRKPPSGRCIAGRELIGGRYGRWIRPISARATEEISEEERRYENGQDPQVLDIIDIPISRPCPSNHQTENHVIDAEYYWERQGSVNWVQLLGAVDAPSGPLWTNSSSYSGRNDRVFKNDLPGIGRSLYLIQPSDLEIHVVTEGKEFGNSRRRVRAQFTYANSIYRIVVTDPVVERQYLNQADGSYHLAEAIVCVSLGALHSDDYAYKLAAAVITPDRAGA